MGLRRCSIVLVVECREREGLWPDTKFDKKNGGSGFSSQCKECRRHQARDYKKAHRAEMTVYLRRWQVEHPERTRELRRNHYLRNTAKEKAAAKAHREANPILRRAYQRLRQVRVKGHWLTDAEWREVIEFYGDRCLKCGRQPSTVDHVIPVTCGGTDTKDNVQPLCRSCNSSKKAKIIDFRFDKGLHFCSST